MFSCNFVSLESSVQNATTVGVASQARLFRAVAKLSARESREEEELLPFRAGSIRGEVNQERGLSEGWVTQGRGFSRKYDEPII